MITPRLKSNVIAFPTRPVPAGADDFVVLLRAVAQYRRAQTDVFWLKECAEALSILAAMRGRLRDDALAPFEAFYDEVEERLRFFPQYYRFFLSMVLDLEDLGMPGQKGEALCQWAAQNGLARAELSDLQRAEAQRLLARRGLAAPLCEDVLAARLLDFASRPTTFAVPNRKAAYELTHIVFYLSEYGKHRTGLGAEVVRSLEYCGLVAFLDQNHDLLAEVCAALRFCAGQGNPVWEAAVERAHERIRPEPASGAVPRADAYHAFMVTGWSLTLAGRPAFGAPIAPDTPVLFRDEGAQAGALRPLSEQLFALGAARRGDWEQMRGRLVACLAADARTVLEHAERSAACFHAFFSEFSRAAAG